MKLIFCPLCQDVVKLRLQEKRTCVCGSSWGQYTDFLHATIGGEAIPIGFANSSFVRALSERPDSGWGRNFEAFVIPKECDTIKIEKEE